jgi:putative transposase
VLPLQELSYGETSATRRNQLRRPNYARPELLASKPNELWSWDITKLLGPQKWTYYYLYVILDVFSRYIVGWTVAHRESAVLAEQLISATLAKQGILPGELTIHADRGSSMTSKPVALLLTDLGVLKTHSRPHVSNDNPYSESQFRTLKYRPGFPARFGSIQDGRAFCRDFFPWYNAEHRHSSLGVCTPESVHYGRAHTIRDARATVLTAAYAVHPERFVRHHPQPPPLPIAAWINPPLAKVAQESPARQNAAVQWETGRTRVHGCVGVVVLRVAGRRRHPRPSAIPGTVIDEIRCARHDAHRSQR